MKKAIADALQSRGYDTLTQVQQAVTNPEYDGADLLVSAQTGSGKTVGFGLAIAPTLLAEDEVFGPAEAPLALIIAPTRELALQVKRELGWLYAQAGAVLASCVGGMDMRDERRALARGAHVVVATPGRLRDHVMRGSIDLSALRAVVLDEADEMLDLGFREDLEFILGETPETRRTLLFSATVPRGIAALAQSYQRDAIRVTTLAETSQHSDIEYQALTVAEHDVENAIINVLRFHEAPNALVFANTRAMVARMTTRLSNRGFSVVSLSGELSQSERSHALQAMRDGRARVCVATDVAARGIDLPNLDLVVHAELPSNHETLLHRSGRTGRAGRKGVSALIVPPKSRRKAERLLGWAKLTAQWGTAPSAEAVNERDEARMLADPMWSEPPTDSEAAPVAKLTEAFTADQLAAAYLRLYHARQSAPEDLSPPDAAPARPPRAAFGPSVWFSLDGGQNDGVEPRRLLPMLCKAGDLTREDIGAIRVQDATTFVEIKEAAADAFLTALGDGMSIEGKPVTRLDTPPDLGQRPAPRNTSRPAGSAGPKPRPRPQTEPRRDAPAKLQQDRPAPAAAFREDTPAPRQAKPGADRRPGENPERSKPRAPGGKPWEKRGDAPAAKPGKKPYRKPEAKRDETVHSDARKKRASDPSQSLRSDGKSRGGAKPKGPKPPVGKPSSKKNRARAAAAGQIKASKGGDAKPRRKG